MNRRQKIIISVTGIFLVLLILVGLTYAYFLTRIDGNDAEKSISVTTANLSLVYSDNSSELIKSTTPIVPGEFEASKTFTVTNNGNAKVDSYAVILEKFSVKYANNVGETIKQGDPTSLVNPNDMKMTITCTITSSDATRNGTSCNGVSNGTLPTGNDILVMNSIEKGDVHNYTVTLEYVETGNNQSDDMNKLIEGRLNIIDGNETVDLTGTVAATDVAYIEVSENTTATQTSNTKTEGKIQRLDEIESNTNIESIAFETTRSYINSDKEYKLVGLPAGNYNVKMYNKSNTQVGSTQTIEILKGDTAGVSGNKITITNESRIVNMDVTSSGLNIGDIENIEITSNPYTKGTLAYEIYKNAKDVTDEEMATGIAKLSEPISTPGVDMSGENEATLSWTEDDYTASTNIPSYYFRGNIKNNYVNFAGICWRIVRIEGDGSVKLILEDQNEPCSKNMDGNWDIPVSSAEGASRIGNFGYNDTKVNGKFLVDYLNPSINSQSTAMSTALKNFQEDVLDEYKNDLKSGGWCYVDKAYKEEINHPNRTYTLLTNEEKETIYRSENLNYMVYESAIRAFGWKKDIYPLSLKCNGTLMEKFGDDKTEMYVGALTAEEIVYAGITKSTDGQKVNYLVNNYQISKYTYFWTLSLFDFNSSSDTALFVMYDGYLMFTSVYDRDYGVQFRPSILLNTHSKISRGNGTINEPYVIDEEN